MTDQATTDPTAGEKAGPSDAAPTLESPPARPVKAAKLPMFQGAREQVGRAIESLTSPLAGSGSDRDADRGDQLREGSDPSSSRASSDDVDQADEPERRPRTKHQLKKALAKGTKSAGGIAHKVLTRHDEAQAAAGVWLVDDETADDIAEPAASLLARRGLKFTADAGDIIDLLVTVAAWATDQLALRRDIKAARDAYRAGVDEPAAA